MPQHSSDATQHTVRDDSGHVKTPFQRFRDQKLRTELARPQLPIAKLLNSKAHRGRDLLLRDVVVDLYRQPIQARLKSCSMTSSFPA